MKEFFVVTPHSIETPEGFVGIRADKVEFSGGAAIFYNCSPEERELPPNVIVAFGAGTWKFVFDPEETLPDKSMLNL